MCGLIVAKCGVASGNNLTIAILSFKFIIRVFFFVEASTHTLLELIGLILRADLVLHSNWLIQLGMDSPVLEFTVSGCASPHSRCGGGLDGGINVRVRHLSIFTCCMHLPNVILSLLLFLYFIMPLHLILLLAHP